MLVIYTFFYIFCVKIIICQSITLTLSDNFSTNWILSCNQIRWKRPNSLITLSCHNFLFIFDEKITHWRGTATSNIIFSFLIDTSQLRSYLRNILTPQFITPFPTNRYILNFIFRLNNSTLYLWLTVFSNRKCSLACSTYLNHVVQINSSQLCFFT